MKILYLTLIALSQPAIICCSLPEARNTKVAAVSGEVIQDIVALDPTKESSLEDIAFTFPAFELGAEETRKSIATGGFKVDEGPNYWILGGDGAQSTIRLDRLTEPNITPMKVRLTVGPVFDGGMGSPQHIYISEFVRVNGGWLQTARKVTEET